MTVLLIYCFIQNICLVLPDFHVLWLEASSEMDLIHTLFHFQASAFIIMEPKTLVLRCSAIFTCTSARTTIVDVCLQDEPCKCMLMNHVLKVSSCVLSTTVLWSWMCHASLSIVMQLTKFTVCAQVKMWMYLEDPCINDGRWEQCSRMLLSYHVQNWCHDSILSLHSYVVGGYDNEICFLCISLQRIMADSFSSSLERNICEMSWSRIVFHFNKLFCIVHILIHH